MNKEEKLIREYFEFDDISQSETIEVLPLTLNDILLEYEGIAIFKFFIWFRNNGEKHIGLSIEDMINLYLNL